MESMKNLLALVMFHKHNIHMLHWNLCGDEFQSNHEYMGELYGEMEDHIDSIAEMYIQEGGTPLTYKEMIDYLMADNADHTCVSSSILYDKTKAFTLAIQMFNEIIAAIDACYSDESVPRAHQSELETMQAWYMLRAKYLMPRRLTQASAE